MADVSYKYFYKVAGRKRVWDVHIVGMHVEARPRAYTYCTGGVFKIDRLMGIKGVVCVGCRLGWKTRMGRCGKVWDVMWEGERAGGKLCHVVDV